MPTCYYEIYVDSDNTGYERIYRSDQSDDNNLILSPRLRKGTNKASVFDFTVLSGHPAYDNFEKMSTYVRLDRDGQTIFYGRVSDTKTDIYKQKEINCEGSLTFLKDSILAPNTFMDITTEQSSGKKAKQKRYPNGEPKMSVESFFRSLITTHNAQMSGTSDINTRKQFTVGTVSVNKRNVVETFEIKSYSDIGSVISSQLLEKYGGIIQTRYDKESAINYIDWIEDYSTTNNQAIEFGVNLLEIDSEKASDELWTILLPIGADGITISSVNNNSLYLPANPADDSMVQKYGKIIHYKKFEDVKKASTLLSKATEYFNLHRKDYPDTLTLKAVDFHYLTPDTKQALDIGTRISVVSAPHGINVVRDCIEMDLDIQVFENSTYTIGSIIPPEYEGKSGKSSLSSRHSSSSRMVGTTFNELSDRIDDLQTDVNINADNIAITAQNMAISVQNLALDLIGDESHTGLITATANELRSEYDEKLYGEEGTYENPIGGIVGEYRSSFNQTAQELDSKVSTSDFNGNEIASRINQTATTILIQAQHINLDGYVTAAQLSTTNANITNLVNGNTVADHIKVKALSANNGLYITNTDLNAQLWMNGDRYYKSPITFLSTTKYYLGTGNTTWDLAHSHAVSVGTDGTVTLGGAVATDATNRSFRIADTKTYKDGVSAATAAGVASVTVNTIRERADRIYNSSTYGTTIFLEAVASNGNTATSDLVISGTQAFNAGADSVSLNPIQEVYRNYDDNIGSFGGYALGVKATTSNGKTVYADYEIEADEVYSAGYGQGHMHGYSEGYEDGLEEQGIPAGADDVNIQSWYRATLAYKKSTNQYTATYRITLSNGHTFTESDTFDATGAYNNGNDVGYSAGLNDGKVDVLNNFTINDVYVYKVGTSYRADVRLHYGSNNYTRGNLTCVRGI